MGKHGHVQGIVSHDFRQGFCENLFRSNFGQNDGCVHSDCDGLTLNSKLFTKTPCVGPNNAGRADGWADNYKLILYTRTCIPVKPCRETVLDTRVAAAQFFAVDAPIPVAYQQRTQNIQADPRFANGQVGFLQPETGMMFGFVLSNQAIHALYGRLPYARALASSCWAKAVEDPRECVPCKTGCPSRYNSVNFWDDLHFQAFKQTASQREWIQFQHYIRWRGLCGERGLDHCAWKEYAEWCGSIGPLLCDAYPRDNWIRWQSHRDWTEYTYYYDWLSWRNLEAEFGHRGACETKCGKTCCGKTWYELPGSSVAKARCNTDGCASCKLCVEGEVLVEKAKEIKRECYAYEWGTVRCCCDFKSAAFLSLIEVARRESCDPLADFSCLSVGIDRSHSTVRWYINNVEVHRHVGIGRRTKDEYRVRENGGYAEDVDVTRVVAFFGTGSILDASLPSNYNRYRARDNTIDGTNLVPLLCPGAYFNIYANRFGELAPVIPDLAFGALGATAQAQTPHLSETDRGWRLFGQGAILRIEYLNVFSRGLPINPVYSNGHCLSACKGPAPAGQCAGRCGGKKGCNGGCCGKQCDIVDASCCNDDLEENYEVVVPGVPNETGPTIQTGIIVRRRNHLNNRRRSDGNPCDDSNCMDISGLNLYE